MTTNKERFLDSLEDQHLFKRDFHKRMMKKGIKNEPVGKLMGLIDILVKPDEYISERELYKRLGEVIDLREVYERY